MTDIPFSPAHYLYFVNKSIQYSLSLESLVVYPISLVPFYEICSCIFVFKYFASKHETESQFFLSLSTLQSVRRHSATVFDNHRRWHVGDISSDISPV